MNWITKFIKPKNKVATKEIIQRQRDFVVHAVSVKILYKDDLFNNLSVCPPVYVVLTINSHQKKDLKYFLTIKNMRF